MSPWHVKYVIEPAGAEREADELLEALARPAGGDLLRAARVDVHEAHLGLLAIEAVVRDRERRLGEMVAVELELVDPAGHRAAARVLHAPTVGQAGQPL